MKSRESRGNAGKRRGYLLLSLILLVWNTFATAFHGGFLSPPTGLGGAEGTSVSTAVFPPSASSLPPESPRNGPLSIRQKYLLGKRIDINKAPLAEISELPGISDKVAAAVVEERERLGRFRSPEDLLSVKGIKEKRLQKILPFLENIPNN